MIKKKQHFVSQFYLRGWAGEGDRLFTSINNNIILMKIKEVAHSNYFYKIDGFNDNERELLLEEAASLEEPIKPMINSLINAFHIIHKISISISEETEDLRKLKANAVEEFYCIVEELGSTPLELIKNEEYERIDVFGYSEIVRYMIYQLARTPAVKNKTKGYIEPLLKDKNIRFDSYHVISSLIISEKISHQLINKLYKLVVIDNKTNVNFITSDNPVKNLNPIENKDVKIFLPLSPKKGLLLVPSELSEEKAKSIMQTELEDLTKDQYYLSISDCSDQDYINNLNSITWQNKERSAFSFMKSDLEMLINGKNNS